MYICQEKILEESVTDLASTMIMIDAICGMNYLFQMKQKSVTIKYKFNAFGHNFKNMTKEELEAKVAKQLSIINDANDKICSCVNDYIESLPYKVGDKVSCSRCDVCWITSIVPKRYYSGYNGEIDVRINPAKKDGTRSNREFVLCCMEVDSIKKID